MKVLITNSIFDHLLKTVLMKLKEINPSYSDVAGDNLWVDVS